jgi:hypothetical protein
VMCYLQEVPVVDSLSFEQTGISGQNGDLYSVGPLTIEANASLTVGGQMLRKQVSVDDKVSF